MYQTYEQEVNQKMKEGLLEEKTAKTYLRHSGTFVRWCRNDFLCLAKEKQLDNMV